MCFSFPTAHTKKESKKQGNLDKIGNTSNIDICVLRDVFDGRDNSVDEVIRANVLDNGCKFQTRNASDFGLNIVDVFEEIGKERLEFVNRTKSFS